MKILIAPDKFKGTLSTFDVCTGLKDGILKTEPAAQVEVFPMADGGDGFGEVFAHYSHAARIECLTEDPLGRPMNASYFLNDETRTAIVELAAASGLALLKNEERDVMKTSTRGTGLLIADAISRGAETIVLGVGGSATNDGGIGILHALGFQFTEEDGTLLEPNGSALHKVRYIRTPVVTSQVKFRLAVDVTNPLTGSNGAAAVYGPQKGATAAQVELLDKGLQHLAQIMESTTGRSIIGVPGMGAAGGVPASLFAFFQAELRSGADMVISLSGLKEAMSEANLVITGEGRMDEQTSEGKLAFSVAALAHRMNVPCIAVCGSVAGPLHEYFAEVISLTDIAGNEERAMAETTSILETLGPAILKFVCR